MNQETNVAGMVKLRAKSSHTPAGVPCIVTSAGAAVLVEAGMAEWTDGGKAIVWLDAGDGVED